MMDAQEYESMLSRTGSRFLSPVALGIIAFLVYLWIAWFILLPEGVWSPDTGAKLLQLQSLRLEDGRLAYDILYPGHELDPNLQFAHDPQSGFLQVRDNALYFQRFPLFPLITLPLFRWFGLYGLYLIPAAAGAAASVVTLLLLRQRDRRFAMWTLAAFGSPVLIYAALFWEHTLAACLGLAAAWIALKLHPQTTVAPRGRILGWLAVAVMLGLSIYIRLEMLIFAGALLCAYWFTVREGRWGPALASGILGLVLLAYVATHLTMFRQPLPDNARFIFYPFRYLKVAGWRALPDLLVGPFSDEAIDPGWLGGLWAIAAVVAIAHSFGPTDSPVPRTIRMLGLATTAVVGASFLFTATPYRSAHGLLFTTPWVLLGLCRAREVWQQGEWRARIIVLTTILGLVGYTAGIIGLRAGSPHGGLEWGARFALVFFPLLALLAGWDLGAKRRDVATLAVYGALLFLGLGFQARGIWTIRQDKQFSAALNEAIVQIPEQHVLTDVWWIPLNAAPVHTEKAIYTTSTPEKLKEWIELAAANRIEHFSLVTFGSALLDDVAPILNEYGLRIVEIQSIGPVLLYRLVIEPG